MAQTHTVSNKFNLIIFENYKPLRTNEFKKETVPMKRNQVSRFLGLTLDKNCERNISYFDNIFFIMDSDLIFFLHFKLLNDFFYLAIFY